MPSMVAQVPLQNNYSDCGVFLLHYIELFLQTCPRKLEDFKRWKISDIDIAAARDTVARAIFDLIEEREKATDHVLGDDMEVVTDE